jgi:probable LLM family oxidoreductase
MMEIGIYTFGDLGADIESGKMITPVQRMKNLLEEIELADQLGIDVFGVGEHHRPDYLVSSPEVVLGAAAVRTKNIKLASAVTVLSSNDPVRVFQAFSTVDLLSMGRAEIIAGRGSFIESFPLFGYDLADYDRLFSEKLDLLINLNKQEKISWKGTLTQSINNLGIYPRPFQENIPIWVAVGGTPESVERAAIKGLPMALAIIGGNPANFAPLANYYKQKFIESGNDMAAFGLGINSHVFIADTSKKASDDFYPSYAAVMSRIGKERGWAPMNRSQFDISTGPKGALLVGSPQQVIDKILYEYELFGNTRFMAQMSIGAMPHEKVLHSIELFGNVVAPAIRKYTGVQR